MSGNRTDLNPPQVGTKVPTWEDLLQVGRSDPAVHLACYLAETGRISREQALVALAIHQARILQERLVEIVTCRAEHGPPSRFFPEPPSWLARHMDSVSDPRRRWPSSGKPPLT